MIPHGYIQRTLMYVHNVANIFTRRKTAPVRGPFTPHSFSWFTAPMYSVLRTLLGQVSLTMAVRVCRGERGTVLL